MTTRKEIEKQLSLVFTPKSLTQKVESLVFTEEMRYSEAIAHICEEHEIDPADIAKIIQGPLKKKIEIEAMHNHVIPNTKGNALNGI